LFKTDFEKKKFEDPLNVLTLYNLNDAERAMSKFTKSKNIKKIQRQKKDETDKKFYFLLKKNPQKYN
jgi:hypothetical protein